VFMYMETAKDIFHFPVYLLRNLFQADTRSGNRVLSVNCIHCLYSCSVMVFLGVDGRMILEWILEE
jgi:hypothetical protein